MNDLDLQRQCIAEPDCQDPDFLAALAANPGAARRATQMRHFDAQLRQALSDVEVPDGLAARVLLRKDFQPRRGAYRVLAAAASLLLGLTTALWLGTTGKEPLDQRVLAHIENEIGHLHQAGQVAPGRLQQLIGHFGGQLIGDLGEVSFASLCPTREGVALHLVIAGQSGPVTVLYVPDARAGDGLLISRGDYRGQAYDAGDGSLAVVGGSGESIAAVRQKIDRAIRWRS